MKLFKTPEVISQEDVRFLIVDDNILNRKILSNFLRAAFPRATIVEAVDGKDAVAKVMDKVQEDKINYFDVIFMDFVMPNLNGNDATNSIREIEEGYDLTKSYVITWSDSEGVKKYTNADAILRKPFKRDIAEETLRQYLRQCTQRQAPVVEHLACGISLCA